MKEGLQFADKIEVIELMKDNFASLKTVMNQN